MTVTETDRTGTLSISETAEATGLSTHTLRYYERAGLLLEPVGRASSSHRRYSERDVTWVTLLTKLRSTGMSIREMREYAELVRLGDATVDARLELLVKHRERVLEQLEVMQSSLTAIDYKIANYQRISAL